MVQVKEFLNHKNNEQLANEWLATNRYIVEVIDIKYAVSTLQAAYGNNSSKYSGMLIIYRTI